MDSTRYLQQPSYRQSMDFTQPSQYPRYRQSMDSTPYRHYRQGMEFTRPLQSLEPIHYRRSSSFAHPGQDHRYRQSIQSCTLQSYQATPSQSPLPSTLPQVKAPVIPSHPWSMPHSKSRSSQKQSLTRISCSYSDPLMLTDQLLLLLYRQSLESSRNGQHPSYRQSNDSSQPAQQPAYRQSMESAGPGPQQQLQHHPSYRQSMESASPDPYQQQPPHYREAGPSSESSANGQMLSYPSLKNVERRRSSSNADFGTRRALAANLQLVEPSSNGVHRPNYTQRSSAHSTCGSLKFLQAWHKLTCGVAAGLCWLGRMAPEDALHLTCFADSLQSGSCHSSIQA